jgi:hypothetical protein
MAKLERRILMELAVKVMRCSLPEPRADGKANPSARAVLWTPDGTVEREYRGELRDGVTRKTAMSAPWIRTPSIVVGKDRPIPFPNRDTHRAMVSRSSDSSHGPYDGYILQDLERSRCRIDGAARHAVLKMTLGGFRVQVNNQKLEPHASPDDIFQMAVP